MVSIDFVHITKMNKLVATGPGFTEFTVEISYNIKVLNVCTSAGFLVVTNAS